MGHFKKSLIGMTLLVVLCISLFLFTSCGKDPAVEPTPDTTVTDYGIDNIYFMMEDGEEYRFTIIGNTFMLSLPSGEQTGTFTYADGALSLTCKGDGAKTASAVIADGVLNLTYDGGTYRMLKRDSYTVTFVNGESTLSTQKVLNGEYAAKPQDPVMDGCAFIGWYADAAYQTVYAFSDARITADTTVYARFEELNGKPTYTVTFVGATETYAPKTTVNGVLYDLPTPADKADARFLGWWMSDYEDATRLTAQYTGQQLTQDVTLYAVYGTDDDLVLSVNAAGFSWNALGVNQSYHIVVKRITTTETTTELDTNSNAVQYDGFDFAGKAAGDYTVTVSANGKETTAYYRNKALDRVANFRVVSSGLLVFDPVANAQEYIVTVYCGSANHKHVQISNGTSTNFVFTSCEMPADGIRFIVTAKADGYVDSTASYTYSLALGDVRNIALEGGKTLTWSAVENAAGYVVSLSRDGVTYESIYVTSGTSYDLASMAAGELYVKIKPVTAGYYAAEPGEAEHFTKTMLARPDGIALSGSKLVWNAVDGATGYVVTINGATYEVTTASFAMASVLVDGVETYEVTVQATAENASDASPVSAVVAVNYKSISDVSYRDGYLSWSPVLDADKYYVRVGDGAETMVPATEVSAPISFTESGTIKLYVSYESESGERSDWVSTTVEVYEIELDVRGGKAVGNLYKAYGDPIELPDTTRTGYTFAGWFLTPNSVESGKLYTSTRHDEQNDLVLYANWTANPYRVTLDPGDGVMTGDTTQNVTYGKLNQLPIAKSTNTANFFVGWYTGKNGTGIRYFDDKGEALIKWNSTEDGLTLYAYYAESLSFTLIDGDAAYAVSKGPYGIGALTEITIPATHTGADGIERPVTTIEGSGFIYCSTLKVINIPNTIESVNTGSDGGNSAGSCFQGCYQLTAVNVYEVEGAIAPKYFSQDGLLYCEEYGNVEVRYCPHAKTGLVTLCEGTTVIPAGTFRSTKVSEVQVPYTVASIGANAFYGSNLNKITFLPTPEDATPVALTMEEKAIYWCRELTEIKLPARIVEFTSKTIQSCSNLTSIDVEEGSASYSAKGEDGRKVLCSADGTKLIFCPVGMTGTFEIPQGVETICTAAFSGCTKLTKVVITGTVSTIEKEAFKGNTSITTVEFDEDGQPLTIGESAFYSCTSLFSLTLPKNLVEVGQYAFGATSSLTEVTINTAGSGDPPEVNFASGAFATEKGVYYVTDITLGAAAPFFDVSGVFGKQLRNITVHEDNPYYASEEGVLYDKGKTKIVFYPYEREGVCDLPETLVEIGENVFADRTALTGVTIGKNVTTVGAGAFNGCTKLEYVRFADGGTEDLVIGDTAFKSCSLLTEVDLPTRLKSIGANAFQSCTKLASVTFPEGLETIGAAAFNGCRALTSVALPSTLKQIDLQEEDSYLNANDKGSLNMFVGCASLTTLTVHASNTYYCTIDNVLYQMAAKTEGADPVPVKLLYCPQQKGGSADVVVPGTVTEVATRAFFANGTVATITFNDLAAGEEFIIGAAVFQGCDDCLVSVKLPKGLTTISSELFSLCYQLEEVTIPATVTSIENKAFTGCKNLERLIFADTAKGETPVPLVIEDAKSYNLSPFNGCAKLTSVVFPERMTVLGAYVFAGKDSDESIHYQIIPYIEQVSFPSTLERIGENAFYLAKKLTSVTFAAGTKLADSGTTPAIGNSAFYTCTALTSVVLPQGDTENPYTIGSNAFAYTAITTLTIPAGVKEIKIYAFFWNDKLTDVTFADGANPTLGTNVFASCTGLERITLPEGMTEIGANMFYNCKKLTEITIPSTVTKIGANAFDSCVSLAVINLTTYTVEAEGAEPAAYSRITDIGDKAFAGTALTSFAFPKLEDATKSLKLGKSLFNTCRALTDVTLTRSVTDLTGVFQGCSSIRNLRVDEDNEYFASIEGDPNLYSSDKKTLTFIVGDITGEYRVKDGVTKIGDNVFENQYGLTKLTLPAGLMEIGTNAFTKCTLLETVVFEHSTETPSQLTTIGTGAFTSCYSLKNVTLPANLTAIAEKMFYYCYALESIELPQGLKTIGASAFYSAGLTSITIPSTVTTIGASAFYGSTYGGKLTSVTFERSLTGTTALTSIGANAFQYQGLLSIEIPKSVTTFGDKMFYNCKNLTTVSFENGTTIAKIPGSAFYGCESLTGITLPSSVTTIGSSAFNGCKALTEITIPAGVTLIDSSAFNNCILLETVTIPTDSILKTIKSSAFSGCESLKEIALPKTITTIGTTAFKNCTNLTTFTFAAGTTGLEKLDTSTFTNCASLTAIAIPDSVTSLGKTLFQNCTSLATVTFGADSALNTILAQCFEGAGLTTISIPEGVTVLGTSKTAATVSSSAKQFLNCTRLESVEFLGSLKLLGGYVFQGCTSLTSVTLPATVTQVGNYCFDGCTALDSVTFTAGTAALTIGQCAFRGSAITSLTVPDRTTKIDTEAFKDCTALTTLTIEAGTKALTLNKSAFEGCSELTSADLSDRVTAIPEQLFYGCTKLATVTGAKVKTIGATAFRNCKALTAITLSDTLTSIGADAFMGSGLTEITIPAKVTSIGDNAFGACADLTKFTVAADNTTFETFAVTENETVLMKKGDIPTVIAAPARVTSDTFTLPNANLGGYALNEMLKNVTTLELPEGVTEIPNYAFIGSCFTSVKLPSTLTKIGTGAFKSSALTSIEIPAGVTTIGANAFQNCRSLTTITFAEGSQLTTLGMYTFAESGLTSITLPAGVTNLNKANTASYTFQDCMSLESVTFLGEITELNGYAFEGCTALKSFTIPASVKSMGAYVFSASGLESITIPKTLDHLYATSSSTTNASNTFKDCLSLREVVIECRDKETVEVDGKQVEQYKTTFINGSAFIGCTALTSVTFPASVSGIGANAFEGCTALTSVTFSDGAQANINGSAFKNCSLLSSVTFGKDAVLTTIGDNAFEGTALVSIEFPASVTTLGKTVFKGCTALESVTFAAKSKLESIGNSAFSGTGLRSIALPTEAETLTLGTNLFLDCTQLESVSMGTNVKAFTLAMFKNCTALKSITIPETVTTIGNTAFEASGLVSVTIPDTVTSYGTSMFKGCLSLETVVIGQGCTIIGANTFDGCAALTSVTIPDTVITINNEAFRGCTALTSLVLPETMTTVGYHAFDGWTAAQTIRVKGSKSLSGTWRYDYLKAWYTGCDAVIVWDYTE